MHTNECLQPYKAHMHRLCRHTMFKCNEMDSRVITSVCILENVFFGVKIKMFNNVHVVTFITNQFSSLTKRRNLETRVSSSGEFGEIHLKT